MAKSQNLNNQTKIIELPWLISIVVVLWIIGWIAVDCISPAAERGTFGDKFGFVNSLFSALAFAGIIYSIFLQKNELALQRQELADTRKEFAQQNFETSFFNLLKNQQEITTKIKATFSSIGGSLTSFESATFTGLDFFKQAKTELHLIVASLQHESHQTYDYDIFCAIPPARDEEEDIANEFEAECAYTNSRYAINADDHEKARNLSELDLNKRMYALFFRKHHTVIGHYFRHLYHIFKFLKTSESEELKGVKDADDIQKIKANFKRYAQFIQAQMSANELLLLYYNCLFFPKSKDLLLQYGILDKISKEDLIIPNVNIIPEATLKSISELFNFNQELMVRNEIKQ